MQKLLLLILGTCALLFSPQSAGAVRILPSGGTDHPVGAEPRHATADSCADNAVCFKLHFANNNSILMRDYRDNASTLAKLDRIFANRELTTWVDSICIEGGASLVGSLEVNERLSRERSEAVRSYLLSRNVYFNEEQIRIGYQVYNWKELKRLVTEDGQTPCREQVLAIISTTESDGVKKERIESLASGWPGRYILNHFARHMRSVSGIIFYMDPETPAEYKEAMTAEEEPQISFASRDSLVTKPAEPVIPVTEAPLQEKDTIIAESPSPIEAPLTVNAPAIYTTKPLFALKTNLLFDAVTAINFEIEVPIGKRWSVAGELIFPWWLNESKQRCFQLMNANVEGRYWLGKREKRPLLTGWFAGLYAGGGYYDLERDAKGYQGEFFIAAGIGGGYAHTINKKGNLRMEYSLGVGFMQTNYRHYEAEMGADGKWHLYKETNGRYTWVGPTKVKVSLVWLLNYKKKGGVK